MTTNNAKYKTGLRRFAAAIIDTLILIPIMFSGFLLQEYITNITLFIISAFLLNSLPYFYSVFMHYKYGKTLGKLAMNIKLVNFDETRNITLVQSLIRDSFPIIIDMTSLIYLLIHLRNTDSLPLELIAEGDTFASIFGFFWILLELVSMLTNDKYRAIHDFMAGSVVINLDINTEIQQP